MLDIASSWTSCIFKSCCLTKFGVPWEPGPKSAVGKGILKVVLSAVVPARRGDVAVAAGRPAKGGRGTDGHDSDRPVEMFSASVSSLVRVRMLMLMQAAGS